MIITIRIICHATTLSKGMSGGDSNPPPDFPDCDLSSRLFLLCQSRDLLVFQAIYLQRGDELYFSCFSWMYRWGSPPHMTAEPLHLRLFLVLSCLVSIPDFQKVLETDPRALWRWSKFTFCFHLSYTSLPTRSFLSGAWGFQASQELGTFVPSFLFITSSTGGYPLEVCSSRQGQKLPWIVWTFLSN